MKMGGGGRSTRVGSPFKRAWMEGALDRKLRTTARAEAVVVKRPPEHGWAKERLDMNLAKARCVSKCVCQSVQLHT